MSYLADNSVDFDMERLLELVREAEFAARKYCQARDQHDMQCGKWALPYSDFCETHEREEQ